MRVKAFACPRCDKIVESLPLFRRNISGYDCPHCGKAFTVREMLESARNTRPASTQNIEEMGDKILVQVVKKHRELHQWSIFLGLALVMAILVSFSPGLRREMGLYALAPAAFALTVLFHIWGLARLLYPPGKAIGLIVLSLLTVTFPFVLYCVDRKAIDYLREHGLRSRILGEPEKITDNQPPDGSV